MSKPTVNGNRQETARLAVRVARLYYFQEMTTAAIAEEMGTSRATVSRLLTHAKENGLVEIRINDPSEQSRTLEQAIRERYGLGVIQVVPVVDTASEADRLQRVAAHAAAYVSTLVLPSSVRRSSAVPSRSSWARSRTASRPESWPTGRAPGRQSLMPL